MIWVGVGLGFLGVVGMFLLGISRVYGDADRGVAEADAKRRRLVVQRHPVEPQQPPGSAWQALRNAALGGSPPPRDPL